MATRRSPARDKAYQMWLDTDGKRPLTLIAEACGVSAGLVRKWKNQDRWSISDGKKKSVQGVTNAADGNDANGNGHDGNGNGHARDSRSPAAPEPAVGDCTGKFAVRSTKRKRGGQPGNCNNPRGNPNLPPAPRGNCLNPRGNPNLTALKTGEYERIIFGQMSADEQALALDAATRSPAEHAVREIALYSVREKRMLDRIAERIRLAESSAVQINGTPMCVSSAENTKADSANGADARKEQKVALENLLSFVTELEDALTRVQSKKLNAVETLHRILRDAHLLELEQRKVKIQDDRLKLARMTSGMIENAEGQVDADDVMRIALGEASEEELRILLKIAEKAGEADVARASFAGLPVDAAQALVGTGRVDGTQAVGTTPSANSAPSADVAHAIDRTPSADVSQSADAVPSAADAAPSASAPPSPAAHPSHKDGDGNE